MSSHGTWLAGAYPWAGPLAIVEHHHRVLHTHNIIIRVDLPCDQAEYVDLWRILLQVNGSVLRRECGSELVEPTDSRLHMQWQSHHKWQCHALKQETGN